MGGRGWSLGDQGVVGMMLVQKGLDRGVVGMMLATRCLGGPSQAGGCLSGMWDAWALGGFEMMSFAY